MFTLAKGSVDTSVHQLVAERRRYRRYPIVRSATILTKASELPCRTINISATGMKLLLSRRGPLPSRFIICLDDHARLLAQLVSRHGNLVRVRLLCEKPMMAWVLRDVVPMAEFLQRFPYLECEPTLN